MRTVFVLNIVDRSYNVVDHNCSDEDAPVLALVLTNQDYPAASLDQDGVMHLTLDPSECPHCHRIIREHLGL